MLHHAIPWVKFFTRSSCTQYQSFKSLHVLLDPSGSKQCSCFIFLPISWATPILHSLPQSSWFPTSKSFLLVLCVYWLTTVFVLSESSWCQSNPQEGFPLSTILLILLFLCWLLLLAFLITCHVGVFALSTCLNKLREDSHFEGLGFIPLPRFLSSRTVLGTE